MIVKTLIVLSGGAAFAEPDHELARQAAILKEVFPLTEVLEIITDRYSATPLKIEFVRDEGRYVYEIELIEADGRIIEVVLDAATGEFLDQEGE